MTAPAPPAPRAPVHRPRYLPAADPDQRQPWQEPRFNFSDRVAIALLGELLAGFLSLALVEPLGAGALPVLPVTVAGLVWWVTRA